MLTGAQMEKAVKILLAKYSADYAVLFGSYARGEQTPESDVDIIVFGGENFKKSNIFAFAEDLRQMTGKNVDAFEISEVDIKTPFYKSVMEEGIRIA